MEANNYFLIEICSLIRLFLDPSLMLNKQVTAVARTVFQQLLLVSQLQLFHSKKDLAIVVP